MNSRHEQVAKLCEATRLLAGPNAHIDDYLSLTASALGSFLIVMEPERQNRALLSIIGSLTRIRKHLFDPQCCEHCNDGNEVVEAVMKTLGHVDHRAAIVALTRVLRILLDIVGDEEDAQDINEDVADALFPDEGLETVH